MNLKPNRLYRIGIAFLVIVGSALIVTFVVLKLKSPGDYAGPKEFFAIGPRWPSQTAKYITAVPIDLTQIKSISKYRSCAGHIRDGYSFDRVDELDSSMKHYVFPIPQFQGTSDKVKMFAPFDGTVAALYWEKDKVVPGRPKNGNGIDFSTPVDSNVVVGYGHLYFAHEFKVGDKVKAGELIGYAALYDKGNDFDIDLKGVERIGDTKDQQGREILGSAFDHMTDAVLAEFAKYGVTPENTKFTKAYRDAHPCGYYSTTPISQQRKDDKINDPDGHSGSDWVQLVH